MTVRPGSHLWERIDNDGLCEFAWGPSTAGIYETLGRGDDTLSIFESDLERGTEGWWLDENGFKFRVEKVIFDPANPEVAIRVISHERPPFGEWRQITQ
ncbi:hypothetical protein [Nocardia tengchongensis]|uniref:hypothetical protein n=1 Tax=Nocardia tengchongensis TaxID=2055889 RepID=UPI003682EC0F